MWMCDDVCACAVEHENMPVCVCACVQYMRDVMSKSWLVIVRHGSFSHASTGTVVNLTVRLSSVSQSAGRRHQPEAGINRTFLCFVLQ